MDRSERIRILEAARAQATLEHDTEGAIRMLEAMLRENPDDLDALMLKGNILDMDGNHEEALNFYQQALNLDPENVPALIDFGDCIAWLGRYQEAIGYYDRALELLKHGKFYLNPRDECKSAYLGKLEALRDSGHVEEARAWQVEMHALFPEFQ